jgi:hypothetical protein
MVVVERLAKRLQTSTDFQVSSQGSRGYELLDIRTEGEQGSTIDTQSVCSRREADSLSKDCKNKAICHQPMLHKSQDIPRNL